MKYRNTKTGIVVEADCEIHGDCWEVVTVNQTEEAEGNSKPIRRGRKTKSKQGE